MELKVPDFPGAGEFADGGLMREPNGVFVAWCLMVNEGQVEAWEARHKSGLWLAWNLVHKEAAK